MPVPPGYLTAEEVAVEIGKSVSWVNAITRDLNIQKTVFSGDNRRRISPEDVERIKAEAAKR